MHDLEQSFARELRIKVRKIAALQREMREVADYCRELVFLVNEVLSNDKDSLRTK